MNKSKNDEICLRFIESYPKISRLHGSTLWLFSQRHNISKWPVITGRSVARQNFAKVKILNQSIKMMAIASKFEKYKYEILYTKLIYSNIQVAEVFKFLTHYFVINKHFLFINKFINIWRCFTIQRFSNSISFANKNSPKLCVIFTMI